MTIYGRFGDVVTIRRLATLADVEKFEGREADTRDLEALQNRAYVVVLQDDGKEQLYHHAFLRASGGLAEIQVAILLLKPSVGRALWYDGRLSVVTEVDEGEYGERVTFVLGDATIRTTPGLDPRFRWA